MLLRLVRPWTFRELAMLALIACVGALCVPLLVLLLAEVDYQ